MASPAESTIKRLQAKFEPHIKPREQINYIRRVLALELGSYAGEEAVQQPLCLNHGPLQRDAGPELRGVHKEYIEALRAHVSARENFEQIAYGEERCPTPDPKPGRSASILEDHLAIARLRKKRDSLVTVQNYLERFAELPIPPQEPRDVEQMLNDGNPQPNVPAEVLNSFAVEQTSQEVNIQSHISLLEKKVLREKLLLRQEEKLLADARARCNVRRELVSNGAKMEALSRTRNELINWIETELSKASAEEKKNGAASQQKRKHATAGAADPAGITAQIHQVQDKYKAYVAARKALLALISCAPKPSMAHPEKANTALRPAGAPKSSSIDYLLIPYVEELLSQSRRQKGLITHKSHFSTTLDNQRRDSSQVIARLAEESQLLAAHPMKDSMRRRSGLTEILTAKHADRPDLASRIKPWLFAADSAKIGTLEAVAENVEVGQEALEKSMEALHEMRTLLGLRDELEEDAGTAKDTVEGDMWLDDGMNRGTALKTSHKKPIEAKPVASQDKSDPWARLHGNLGLIGHDDVPL